MIYVIGDIHGCHKEFLNMLKLIDFSAKDDLFVLGDVVDRGEAPIPLLLDIMSRKNIHLIKGNHDNLAEKLLRRIYIDEVDTLTSLDIKQLSNWLCDGGRVTKEQFRTLDCKTKKEVLDYIRGSPAYNELTVNGQKFILIHGGLPDITPGKKLYEYDEKRLMQTRTDYSKQYRADAILVTGHTPTFLINEEYRGKIYRKFNHIALDCGCVFGESLGCMCLNNMKEYYVKKGD